MYSALCQKTAGLSLGTATSVACQHMNIPSASMFEFDRATHRTERHCQQN